VTNPQLLIAAGGILTFAFLGAVQALYGPLVPGLQRTFGVGASDAGLVFAAHGFGALAGIFAPSLLQVRALAGRWLRIATGLLLVGAAALYLAPTWSAFLAAAFVLALGFGVHVVRLNGLFVAAFGARGMTMSQLINAAFSVGSILGPLILGLSGAPSRGIFAGVALAAAALLALNIATDRRARGLTAAPLGQHGTAGPTTGSRIVLAGFVAMMCFIVGVENSIGGWTTTLALASGYSFPQAANFTELFFGPIFLGRLLAAGVGHRVPAGALVVGAIGCIAALVATAALTRAGPIAFALAGFAIAPIFSATLVWVGRVLPITPYTNAMVIGGAVLGNAVFPALVGRVIGRFGPAAAPPAILCLAAAALVVALWLQFMRRT
jgi:predicted MFS family arabinose efflux permease